jgi:hypothetical protein
LTLTAFCAQVRRALQLLRMFPTNARALAMFRRQVRLAWRYASERNQRARWTVRKAKRYAASFPPASPHRSSLARPTPRCVQQTEVEAGAKSARQVLSGGGLKTVPTRIYLPSVRKTRSEQVTFPGATSSGHSCDFQPPDITRRRRPLVPQSTGDPGSWGGTVPKSRGIADIVRALALDPDRSGGVVEQRGKGPFERCSLCVPGFCDHDSTPRPPRSSVRVPPILGNSPKET